MEEKGKSGGQRERGSASDKYRDTPSLLNRGKKDKMGKCVCEQAPVSWFLFVCLCVFWFFAARISHLTACIFSTKYVARASEFNQL